MKTNYHESTTPGPFIGAAAYSASLSQMFFGRRREGEELLDEVYVQRVVVVHAPSGSGKTSLLQAFLIPQLKERAFCTQTAPLRPSTLVSDRKIKVAPATRLRSALLESFGIEPRAELVATTSVTLEAIRGTAESSADVPLMLIVVDQTEELFAREEFDAAFQRAVFEELGEFAEDSSVWLVLSIREDYLARLLAFEDVFAKGLRSRFAVPLFTGLVAEDIVASSLAAFDVHVSQAKLRQFALTLARSNSSARSRKMSDETVLNERVVEPLFLQLVARRWWADANGVPEVMERASLEDESLTAALGAHIDEAFDSAARLLDQGDDTSAGQTDLRLTVQDLLTDGPARKQGDLPERHHEAALSLESSGILRKTHPSSDRVELAHDQLVHALEVSNHRWMEALPNGDLAYRAHRWRASRHDRSKLLSAPELLTWWRKRRSLPSDLQEYVSKSFRYTLVWPLIYGSVFVAFLIATIWMNFKRHEAERERDAFQEQTRIDRQLFEAGAHSFGIQEQIVDAYTMLSRDAASAAASALTALRVAREKPIDRANLTSRAESVLGRIVALNPAVDRWKASHSTIHILEATADGQLIACQAGRKVVIAWETRELSPSDEHCEAASLPVTAQLESKLFRLRSSGDRNDYKITQGFPAEVRTAYAFHELARSDSDAWDRRLWPTFATEELFQRHGNELDYPPRERSTHEISVASVFMLDDQLVGYSISPKARLYPWHARVAAAENCASKPVPADDSENDHCRIVELERPIQLFPTELASVSRTLVSATSEPRRYEFYASSVDGQLARVRWQENSKGSVWPAQYLYQDRQSHAMSIFFDRKNHRAWLVNAARAPTILRRTPNKVIEGASFFRAMWCVVPDCMDRTAVVLRRDGAAGWVSLDDDNLSAVNVKKRKGFALQNRLVIEDVAPILDSFAFVVGSKNETSPLLALVHADANTKTTSISEVPDSQDLLSALAGNPRMIDANAGVLVLSAGQSAFGVCEIGSLTGPPHLSHCKRVPTPLQVTAVNVGEHNGRVVIAVGLHDGSVQLYGRDGVSLHTADSMASSGRDVRFFAHFGPVKSVLVFSTGDGVSRVATGGEDGRVKVWIVESATPGSAEIGQVPLNVASHDGYVGVLEYEDGRLFSSGEFSITYSAPIDSALIAQELCQDYVVDEARLPAHADPAVRSMFCKSASPRSTSVGEAR